MPLEHTRKCYKYYPSKTTWRDGLRACQSESNPWSNLASIHDRKTNDFLTKLSGGREWTWIGGYQNDRERWFWSDNSKWTGFTNWGRGQPDDMRGREDYLGINLHQPGHWNDFDQDLQRAGRLCQYEPK